MFERSLLISQESHAPAEQRWIAISSIAVQVGLATVLIVIPLLQPESMPFRSDVPKALMPNLKVSKVKPVIVEREIARGMSATLADAIQRAMPMAPATIPHGISQEERPPVASFTAMGNPGGISSLIAGTSDAPARSVTVIPARPSGTPLHVSSGVSTGMLLAPIRPVYPAIAKAAHVEGTVIVEALISKSGLIESLHVVSGPEMLRAAAMDAIRAARYQPFRLSGEPAEVQTTITVNFRIGS